MKESTRRNIHMVLDGILLLLWAGIVSGILALCYKWTFM